MRSRQRKHNLNCKYNLMGFDTMEINLVLDNLWVVGDRDKRQEGNSDNKASSIVYGAKLI